MWRGVVIVRFMQKKSLLLILLMALALAQIHAGRAVAAEQPWKAGLQFFLLWRRGK